MPAIEWKKLSNKHVDEIKLPKKTDKPNQLPYISTESHGRALVLVVSYGGCKTWRGLKYERGKPVSEKLGTWPTMGVEAAKEAARDYWDRKSSDVKAGSFRDVAENWFKRHVEKNNLRSGSEIARILGRAKDGAAEKEYDKPRLRGYIYPQWGDRPFIDIRRSDVNALLDEIEDKHGAPQADACLAVVRQICGWWQVRDESYLSPVVRGMKRDKRKAGDRARKRTLNDDELRALWNVSDGSFGGIVKLCLLTGQRREKVGSMRWSDLKDGVWHVPHEEREKGVGGALKLPKMALAIIEEQPEIKGNAHVFAGRGKAAFNAWSQRKAELDAKLPELHAWRIHDLRRTARSLMSRADVRPDIAERVLGHAISGVAGVYDRHRYEAQKAQALEALAGQLVMIVNPPVANVIAMPKRRQK